LIRNRRIKPVATCIAAATAVSRPLTRPSIAGAAQWSQGLWSWEIDWADDESKLETTIVCALA
jgi:hypothetical protein